MSVFKSNITYIVAVVALGGLLGVVMTSNQACSKGINTGQQAALSDAGGHPPIDAMQPRNIQTAAFATG